MTRILFIIAIVGIALWWMFGRRRGDAGKPEAPAAKKAAPQAMVACAHCGVHLPQTDTVADAEGRLFCGEAHRLAGPR
jgi:uncharacterized protein